MVTQRKMRELDLSAATGPGSTPHVSAASGLVCTGTDFYVVADDELHLGAFDATHTRPGQLVRLFSGELPAAKAQRKALKPDLETLMRLPPLAGYTHGTLLAPGSGSTGHRRRGALLALDAQGSVSGRVREIDLSALLDELDEHIAALNIEGGFVNGNELCLLQQSSKKKGGQRADTLCAGAAAECTDRAQWRRRAHRLACAIAFRVGGFNDQVQKAQHDAA